MAEKTNWLVHDHRQYEQALRDCEEAAGAGDWKVAVRLFYACAEDLKLHMRMEDEVVYPVFREEVDDPQDELGELIEEHDDLARLLNDLAIVIRNHDFDHFEDSLDPLHQVMTRHNAHEEAVLSRMGEDSLLTRRDEILRRLEAIQPAAAREWVF